MDKKEAKYNDLWAITPFFNPIGYQIRLKNFMEFRKQLRIPLLAIELSFDGNFELDERDAEILIQLRGRDILWHKERLLNIALKHLPEECSKVAWLDCDMIFGREDWDFLLRSQLEKFQLVQIFQEVCDLPKGFSLDNLGGGLSLPTVNSTCYRAFHGMGVARGLRDADHRSQESSANGLAWAATRKLLDKHGFYDACILGSGDRAMVCAALGEFEAARKALYMSDPQFEHYMAWAKPFNEDLQGKVGYANGTIYHLWHGNPSKRRIGSRYKILKPYMFDPHKDITLGQDGCWEWVDNRKKLSDIMRKYFLSRMEDN